MHLTVFLLLAFLAHICAIRIAMHRELKQQLQMCINYSTLLLCWFEQPRRIIPSARFALLFIAICAAEDVILPSEFGGWFTIATMLIIIACFRGFLSGTMKFIINCAIIGLIPRMIIANFVMLYVARALYAILLSYVDCGIANYYRSWLELRTICPRRTRNVGDPNGLLTAKLRAMW